MQKVFDTYAQRKGIQASSLRFLLDGEKIGPDQTPKMLELDDQDQIDCMLEQVRTVASIVGSRNGISVTLSFNFILTFQSTYVFLLVFCELDSPLSLRLVDGRETCNVWIESNENACGEYKLSCNASRLSFRQWRMLFPLSPLSLVNRNT